MDSVRLPKGKCGVRFSHTFFYSTLQKKGKCGFFETHFHFSILCICIYARMYEYTYVYFYLT